MNTTPKTEDRVWAVISHLSSLAFGMGIPLPVVGWSDQRRKSNYAAFQSLQALGYQSLGFTIWILTYAVMIIFVSILLIAISFQAAKTNQPTDTFFGTGTLLLLFVIFGFFTAYFFLPIIAAVACALGKDFRYPILGDRLARYLQYEPQQKSDEPAWLNEEHEFRWVAAMGHFSILIIFWGMLAPLIAWILYGKRNRFMNFQSLQTLIYQGLTTILYFAGGFMYLFGFLALIAGAGVVGNPDFNSPRGMIGMIVFGISLLISFGFILLMPFLHILGQWAGVRVLKGDDYRYPLIGKLVEKFISRKTALDEEKRIGLEGELP